MNTDPNVNKLFLVAAVVGFCLVAAGALTSWAWLLPASLAALAFSFLSS